MSLGYSRRRRPSPFSTRIGGDDKPFDDKGILRKRRKRPLSISPLDVRSRGGYEKEGTSRMEERKGPNTPLRPTLQEGAFTLYRPDPYLKSKVVASSEREEKAKSHWQKMRQEKKRRRRRAMSGIKKVGSILGDIFS